MYTDVHRFVPVRKVKYVEKIVYVDEVRERKVVEPVPVPVRNTGKDFYEVENKNVR